MLKTGAEHLESLRDGRVVYIGGERVDDVTAHPAFRNAARSMAAIYDLKRSDPAYSFEEGGARHSAYFLRARTRADLEQRTRLHRAIADLSYGLLGRSPDHVSSFVTGMAMNASVFGKFEANLLRYYEHMRDEDIYGVYAVIPPQAARNPEFYVKQNLPVPTLRVVREDDDGVVISGMKMLATGAVFANEIWIGNLIPLAPSQLAESITCAVPVNAPGVTLWSRKPFERMRRTSSTTRSPGASTRSDSMVMCDNVKVPWERVFVHQDAVLAREIYIKTPGHCYGNHQSNVRFHVEAAADRRAGEQDRAGLGRGRDPGGARGARALLGARGDARRHDRGPDRRTPRTGPRATRPSTAATCTPRSTGAPRATRRSSTRCASCAGGGMFQMPADITVMHDPKLQRAVRDLLADAAAGGGRAHEAVQARLGPDRLGVRRAAPAVREVLRRGVVHRAQPQLPRGAVGSLPPRRRGLDGELRRSGRGRRAPRRVMVIQELVIAGWTGRDEAALRKHIEELAAIGVKPPKTTPIFYRVAASLFTHADAIQVSGPDTSGEVEFVLVQGAGAMRVAVGSDHTDRKAETVGVSLSKQLCAKPVSKDSWRYDEVRPHWDRLMLRAWADEALYQEGPVTAMRSPEDLLQKCGGLKAGSAMFCGTLAALGGIRPAKKFTIELEDPVLGRKLRHAYWIEPLPVNG